MDPNNSAVPAPFFDLYTIHFLLEVVQVFDFFSVYNDFIIFFTQSSFSLSLPQTPFSSRPRLGPPLAASFSSASSAAMSCCNSNSRTAPPTLAKAAYWS
jgi:hypothetical protein